MWISCLLITIYRISLWEFFQTSYFLHISSCLHNYSNLFEYVQFFEIYSNLLALHIPNGKWDAKPAGNFFVDFLLKFFWAFYHHVSSSLVFASNLRLMHKSCLFWRLSKLLVFYFEIFRRFLNGNLILEILDRSKSKTNNSRPTLGALSYFKSMISWDFHSFSSRTFKVWFNKTWSK